MKIIIFLALILFVDHAVSQCWHGSYGRGVGKVASSCNNDEEKDGALCYPKCKTGYNGVGPVCWDTCPSDYTDTGAFCTRPSHIYGKGCCCTAFTKKCCKKCRSGYKDDGCTCRRDINTIAKKSYTRGAGSPLGCGSGEEFSAGICYPVCRTGYKGIGPVCWTRTCYGAYNFSCAALCTLDSSQCSSVTKDIAEVSASLGVNILIEIATLGANPDYAGLIADGTGLAASLINDVCGYPNKLATTCWKKLNSNKDGFTSCNANNTVDCGLYCASSKVICAKQTVTLVSNIFSIYSMVSSGFDLVTKGLSPQEANAVKSLADKYPSSKIVSMIEDFADIYKSQGFQGIALFYNFFSQVIGVFNGVAEIKYC